MMLSIPAGVRIYLALEPCDMRRGFDGLALLVQQALGKDPFCGHLYIFRGKGAGRVKILYADQNGLAREDRGGDQGARRHAAVDDEERPDHRDQRRDGARRRGGELLRRLGPHPHPRFALGDQLRQPVGVGQHARLGAGQLHVGKAAHRLLEQASAHRVVSVVDVPSHPFLDAVQGKRTDEDERLVLAAARGTGSLDVLLVDGGTQTVGTTLADDRPTAEEELIARQDESLEKDRLRKAVDALPEPNRSVLRARRLQDPPESVGAAARLELSTRRIQQIVDEALDLLREAMGVP